jgi:uncharacterized protein YqcC (DUF446 family)
MKDNQYELKKRHLLLQLVNQLEEQLRIENLWQLQRPSEAALSSNVPFAIDSLTFVQWLQFIFIDKMTYLLQFSLPLPKAMSVLPMAEESFKKNSIHAVEVLDIIERIDLLISENKQ